MKMFMKGLVIAALATLAPLPAHGRHNRNQFRNHIH